ncbi:phosphorothioated DNA-binding restriction endonuclease [Aureliella helgolandensis]|nr:HNH endonuclease [Aureliella helgolandensis]
MTDNNESLLHHLRSLNVWRRDGERAPHKPLLVLLALAKCSRGEPRLIPYAEIDKPLQDLLREFGPPRKSFHSEYPFWRLQNDGIWELANAEQVEARAGNNDAKKSELLKYGVSGGFKRDVYEALASDRSLLRAAASLLLESTFPDSYHEDILSAVGLDDAFESTMRRKRDPKFRELVLMAYEYQCAICGMDLRLGGRELGLEAAHIKWHQAGGPDIANNGLALCSLHHKLLDRGAIGITPALRVQVSQLTSGNAGFQNWVLPFNGTLVREPQSSDYVLEQEFIDWHTHEVFRAPPREWEVS